MSREKRDLIISRRGSPGGGGILPPEKKKEILPHETRKRILLTEKRKQILQYLRGKELPYPKGKTCQVQTRRDCQETAAFEGRSTKPATSDLAPPTLMLFRKSITAPVKPSPDNKFRMDRFLGPIVLQRTAHPKPFLLL